MLEKVSQGGCEASILRDSLKLTGYSPWQPALVDPALSRAEDGLSDLMRSLPTSTVFVRKTLKSGVEHRNIEVNFFRPYVMTKRL